MGAMIRAGIRVDRRLAGGLQALLGAPMAACSGCDDRNVGRNGGIGHSKRRSRTGMAPVGGDVQLAGRRVSGGRKPSGWEGNGSQPGQGASELGFPGPAPGEMQSEAAHRAGEPSGQGEEPPSEGLGGCQSLAETDAGRPAGRVVGHRLDRQPGGVGGEAPRGEMVEAHTVLEVADGILDLGVAAMVGLQFQGVSLPAGDEAVIAVGGEEGQLGTGRGLHPPDDEPHRGGAGLALEGGAELV